MQFKYAAYIIKLLNVKGVYNAIHTIEGGELSPSQKEDLIKQITEVSSKIMKIPSDFFMVTIKELPDNTLVLPEKQ